MTTLIKYPKIVYQPKLIEVDNTNNKIDFEETAATPLVATIANGTYPIGEFRYQVKTALEAAGASSYTVTYDHDTDFFKITSNGAGGGGIFEINWSSGPNTANSVGPTMGYDVSDLTGALFYEATNTAPLSVTLTFTRYIRRPRFRSNARQKTLVAVSGSNETNFLRNDRTFSFEIEFLEQDDLGEWEDFMENCYLAGGQFDYYPDESNNSDHIALIASSNSYNPTEMNSIGLIGFWRMRIDTRLVEKNINTPAGSNTITYQELKDRVNV